MPKGTKPVKKDNKKVSKASKKINKAEVKSGNKKVKKIAIAKDIIKSKTKDLLEVGLLCDCTSSMFSWIVRAKNTLIKIMENIVESSDGNLKVRVCFIGYRDHCDTNNRFSI